MHELPVAQSLLEISLRHAEQAKASRILRLNITIGQLSTIVDDSVQFYWDLIAEGTLAQNATLVFNRVPARLECQECQTVYSLGENDFRCPACHSDQVTLLSGTEFSIDSIDIE